MSIEAVAWVLRHSEATLGRRLVLIALADHAHPDGSKAWPAVATLARQARMTRKSVQSALRKLEEEREIVCTGTTRAGTRIYSIVGLAPVEKPGDNGDNSGEKPGDAGAGGAYLATSRGVEATPDPFEEPSKAIDPVVEIAETWGKNAPPLIAHPPKYFKSARFKTAVVAALRTYELPAVVKAVENYAAVVASPAHYWTHRYSAVDFLRRERATPGVERFVDEALPFENFRTAKDTDRDGTQQRSPAEQLASAERWVLTTAWRLPLDDAELAEALGQRGVEGPDRARLVDLARSKREAAAA